MAKIQVKETSVKPEVKLDAMVSIGPKQDATEPEQGEDSTSQARDKGPKVSGMNQKMGDASQAEETALGRLKVLVGKLEKAASALGNSIVKLAGQYAGVVDIIAGILEANNWVVDKYRIKNQDIARMLQERGVLDKRTDKEPTAGSVSRFIALARWSLHSLITETEEKEAVLRGVTINNKVYNSASDALRTSGVSFSKVYESFADAVRAVKAEKKGGRPTTAGRTTEEAFRTAADGFSAKVVTEKDGKEVFEQVKATASVENAVAAICAIAVKFSGKFDPNQHASIIKSLGEPCVVVKAEKTAEPGPVPKVA